MEICLWNEKISDILRAFFSMILIFIWGGQTGAGQVITVAEGEHIFNIYLYIMSVCITTHFHSSRVLYLAQR